jgi:hypothetical protein
MKGGPVHVWNEGKISEEQKVHATAANAFRAQIQQRLRANFAGEPGTRSDLALIATLLGDLHYQLAVSEARLWAASKSTVRAIEASAAMLLKLLHDHRHKQAADVVEDVMGHARAVDDLLHTLTNIQSHTMLTLPGVGLAHDIANECRFAKDLNAPIHSHRYQRWVEQASANSSEPSR